MMNLEAMKEQTFGVEVEMNNITRERASKIAARYFGTGRYEYTAGRNGYLAWSAWDQAGREWKFVYDASIAGPRDQQCEMVTPICHYEDIELLQGLVREMRKAGAKSDYTRGCGVHIHIGSQGHTPKSLRNLVNLMYNHEATLITSLGIARSRLDDYCQTVEPELVERLNKEKPETMEAFQDVWYEANHAESGRRDHYNHSRYHMLNLHATFTKGTIEFRLFQFQPPKDGKQNGLHAGQLRAYVLFCMGISQMAKELRFVPRRKNNTIEEDKHCFEMFFFRNFGTSEEFKVVRNLFTSNLLWPDAWKERFAS